MDSSHLPLSKNLSITFHIFPRHYKSWYELVRNSVWNRERGKQETGIKFKVHSPFFFTMGTGSFLGVKQLGRGADHPPPSKCRGQERVGLYLYSPCGPSWSVMGAPLPHLSPFLQYMALFYRIRLYFTPYFVLFFVYIE